MIERPPTVPATTPCAPGVHRLWMLTEFAAGIRQPVHELMWSAVPGDPRQPERPDTTGVSYRTRYIPPVHASLDLLAFHPVAAAGDRPVPGVRLRYADPDGGRTATITLAVPDADLAPDGAWAATDRTRFLAWAGIRVPDGIPVDPDRHVDLPARIGVLLP